MLLSAYMTTLATLKPKRLESELAEKDALYSRAEAKAEAERCLYCVDAPCIKACPTSIDIPTFIKKIASDNVRGSARTILEQNLLGYSCARVCPVEVLCVGDCVYNGWGRDPIQIGRLQRYATETVTVAATAAALFPIKPKLGKRVALLGAGPASLACAGYLALEGVDAVIFEKRNVAGGLNSTGIAPYKLHVEDSLKEVAFIQSLGVHIEYGAEVGANMLTATSLLRDYDAVFFGLGLGADTTLGLPGEDAAGVIGATRWIEAIKLELETTTPSERARGGYGERVLVIGGGNTAIDAAREAVKLGAASVSMAYRRSRKDMSGYAHELEGATLDGVQFIENAQPIAYVHNASNKLTAVRFARTRGGKAVAGEDFDIPCDLCIVAIGQGKLQELAASFVGVALDPRGCVQVNAKRQTGNVKVYAGGDCVNGGKEVVNAVADGREAARAMVASFVEAR
jgi:dihydropyrimidine dehydrogenase (NAD+) subunit PreT